MSNCSYMLHVISTVSSIFVSHCPFCFKERTNCSIDYMFLIVLTFSACTLTLCGNWCPEGKSSTFRWQSRMVSNQVCLEQILPQMSFRMVLLMHANKIFIDPSASSVLLVEFDCMVSKRAEPSKTILMESNRIYIYKAGNYDSTKWGTLVTLMHVVIAEVNS